MPRTSLDLLKGLSDRLVAVEINLKRFNSVGNLWTFLLKQVDGKIGLVRRSSAKKNVVGLVRL